MPSAVKCPICEYENPDGQTKCRRCGTPMPESSGPEPSLQRRASGVRLRQGQLLANRYYIMAEIGRGGMGSIYRAKDNTLKEEVALKTLLPQFLQDKHVVERFFNEARIARTLSHPNIVRVHDIGASQGTVYISMELLSGKSLRQILDGLMPGDRLPIGQVLDIFEQLCAALEYAHKYTVHRDLKPENVMVMDDGSIKLMDFGISKLMGDASLTSASMVMGTPHYMPPEQVKHSAGVDRRADIYSLGVMLYETLTGNLPTAIHKPVSKVVRSVPPSLDPIIETCLQDDPNRRYPTAAAMREALAAVREHLGLTAGAVSFRSARSAAAPMIDNPQRLIGFALLAVLLAGTVLGLWRAEVMRSELIVEGAAVEPPATRTDGPPTVPAELQPLTLDAVLSLLPTAAIRADAAVRGLAAGGVKQYREQVLHEADEWREAALEYQQTDPQLALSPATRALHLYLALIHWPDNAVLIPPSDSDAGFFIQARPVSAAAFRDFVKNHQWRAPERLERLADEEPTVYVTWYDAQGFLAAQDELDRLPTEQQWTRAVRHARAAGILRWIGTGNVEEPQTESERFGDNAETNSSPPWAPELWIQDGLLEWTRPETDSETDAGPEFGQPLPVCGAIRLEEGFRIHRDQRLFEQRPEEVGFRGISALPVTEQGAKTLLQ